ncbi:glycosyltransferase family 4 protein [Deinococcus ruber]|nr:glycosyltransferase family 4 protein [Deinococcus ruber]
MKIALLHNRYLQRGGEDVVVDAERNLLTTRHEVLFYETDSRNLPKNRLKTAALTIYNPYEEKALTGWLREQRPDVLHVHNTFPLLSPQIYWSAALAEVPLVQTLHNYRTVCMNGLLFRDGHPCMECVGRSSLPGILHACYRESRTASAVVAGMIEVHRLEGSYQQVNRYLALTEEARQTFIEGGLPSERITVKPNFTADHGIGKGDGGYALFVGRISSEKGVETLLKAWHILRGQFQLKIVGDGPEMPRLQQQSINGVEWLGRKSPTEVAHLMRGAAFLILPSECFEGMPMTVLEAFSAATPVIASYIGSLKELVTHEVNGRHFSVGDPVSLSQQVQSLLDQPSKLQSLRNNARAEYERNYTPEIGLTNLERIYQETISIHRTRHD